MSYNVVFEGTGEARSNFLGIRTWTDYRSKQFFDQIRKRVTDIILAEGISDGEAILLVSKTKGEARAKAAILQSREFPDMAEMYLFNQMHAAIQDGTDLDYLEVLRTEAPDLYAKI